MGICNLAFGIAAAVRRIGELLGGRKDADPKVAKMLKGEAKRYCPQLSEAIDEAPVVWWIKTGLC